MAIARTFAVIIVAVILIFVGAVTLGGMAVYSKQSSFCASCKVMQTRYAAWERSTHARSVHAKADCINCHSEPGIIGEFKAHFNGARYVFERVTETHQGAILGAKVYSKSCEECHKVGEVRTKNAGHEVNHGAHLAHNLECVQCHRDIAHGTLLGEPTVHTMQTCASCHRQQQYQIAKCGLCHPKLMIDNIFLTAKRLRSPM
ncbi:MAG TPA: NapC/NirT family cytochrome c [Desulfomonilaceae bacterium]|nr:NapC/NirT family cytochrome c [Desulfomonilaceae bacterium]